MLPLTKCLQIAPSLPMGLIGNLGKDPEVRYMADGTTSATSRYVTYGNTKISRNSPCQMQPQRQLKNP